LALKGRSVPVLNFEEEIPKYTKIKMKMKKIFAKLRTQAKSTPKVTILIEKLVGS